jgi:hypothetical protein
MDTGDTMNFHNSTQAYLRPVTNIGIRQQLHARDVRDLPGGLVLWRAVGKVALVLLPLVLTMNLMLASAVNDIGGSFVAVDNQRHELMDKNIELLAKKARLTAPDNVLRKAGEKLALYAASDDQVQRIN